jgi:hypothetical protein
MAFADTIKELPFAPQTQNGRGFFPPMFRASQHILFLVACVNDKDVKVSEAEAQDELKQALDHWNARAETQALSTNATTRFNLVGRALTEAVAEYKNWDEKTRTTNLQDLAHRIALLAADADRELLGIRESDPGRSL